MYKLGKIIMTGIFIGICYENNNVIQLVIN